MDFMSDALSDGRKIRVLNIIDDFNREVLGLRSA
jgi:putative transposase